MKKISVLHLINDLSINGGAQRLVYEISQLSNGKVNHNVITIKKYNKQEDYDCRSIHISIMNFKKILILLIKCDKVHVHLFPFLYLASLIPSKKKIYTEHNSFNKRRKSRVFQSLENFIYRRYDKVICISNEVYQSNSNWLKKGALKNHVIIPNGVNLLNFKRPTVRSLENDNIYLIMTARFTEQKRQDNIVRSLEYLPDNYRCQFVGGGDRRKIEKLVKKLNLEHRVKFLGLQNNVPSLLANADIYIQSVNWEGFGLAVVEAMASGLPVLCSKTNGLLDIVGRCDNIFNSPEELAQKILYITSKKEIYLEYSNYSLMRAENFSFDKMIAQYEKIWIN